MSQELQTMQNELTIAKQQNEIMELKFKLQKTQAEKASRLDDSLFAPALYEHYQKVAVTLSKSNVIPNAYKGKPEDIFVAMAMGYQLGFPVEQSLQDIAVINGRPCLWGDGLLSLCLNHPDCEGIDEQAMYDKNTGTIIGYQCQVRRRGHNPHVQTFTLEDAKRAGLLSKKGVWEAYTSRMLQMRARSLALRDKFADALRGLRVAEIEADDEKNIIEVEAVNHVDPTTQTKKLKEILSQAGKNAAPADEPKEEAKSTGKGVHNTGSDDSPATEEQQNEIDFLMREKGFDDARRKKAMDYFKVKSLSELTNAQAIVFLLQLGKA